MSNWSVSFRKKVYHTTRDNAETIIADTIESTVVYGFEPTLEGLRTFKEQHEIKDGDNRVEISLLSWSKIEGNNYMGLFDLFKSSNYRAPTRNKGETDEQVRERLRNKRFIHQFVLDLSEVYGMIDGCLEEIIRHHVDIVNDGANCHFQKVRVTFEPIPEEDNG